MWSKRRESQTSNRLRPFQERVSHHPDLLIARFAIGSIEYQFWKTWFTSAKPAIWNTLGSQAPLFNSTTLDLSLEWSRAHQSDYIRETMKLTQEALRLPDEETLSSSQRQTYCLMCVDLYTLLNLVCSSLQGRLTADAQLDRMIGVAIFWEFGLEPRSESVCWFRLPIFGVGFHFWKFGYGTAFLKSMLISPPSFWSSTYGDQGSSSLLDWIYAITIFGWYRP